jgi:hypothetical protein
MMYVAVKIETKNDSSGNPRRGWIVRDVREGHDYGEGPAVFVPENYDGRAALDREFPAGVVVVATVTVTPGEYRDRMRGVDYQS